MGFTAGVGVGNALGVRCCRAQAKENPVKKTHGT